MISKDMRRMPNSMEAGNPIHLRSRLMKPGVGLAQIISKDKKLGVGKERNGKGMME
jgi:hypothetical protein